MALILCIETATPICSIALVENDKVIGIRESIRKNSHAEVVTLFIDELFKEHNLKPGNLDAIVVSKGPGSYTGLRIGVSTAKGLCYATGKPLIAINTLQSMALGLAEMRQLPANAILIPMIDARRMEVYAAVYNHYGQQVRETKAEIVEKDSYDAYLSEGQVYFFGDGASKCREIISHPNAIFVNEFIPSAAYMSRLAIEKHKANQFEDVAYFEPYYLKDFVAGIPKVKGLK
ncbi:MAG: tRNA (adenosine(37)-N6)-threonylcarbamoyltransferase complex dimerization subunit type 1 TsaB [Bacteroidetes bacterium]|nr:tRNA (adenosine(37)-N6)-threonylcarbamoyltransferase complex dimerization subunit type 1 TsaB [Bacteroidota bacterium]